MGKHQHFLCLFHVLLGSFSLLLVSLQLPPSHGHVGLNRVSVVDGGGDDGRHQLQAYIIHVEKPDHMVFATPEERADWYKSFLPSTLLDSGEPRLIYSYEKAISGFAARLTPAEVEAMECLNGFLYAVPDAAVALRTTHSQHFLGLDTSPGGLWDLTNKGEGIIIGVFDTGIDPTHPSFDDAGMPQRPPAWTRHPCQFSNATYRCNNKVIGAMAFDWQSFTPPVADDRSTHGTLVANCAAGSPVPGANYQGHATGTSWGAAPRAHIAVYRAESSADVLKAYDQAIIDRVDVFSVSQGFTSSKPFHADMFAIGALSAVENGIFVSVAAGNSGPDHGTILEVAPWTLSVGASSIDRVIEAAIQLGEGSQVLGESLFSSHRAFPTRPLQVVYPGAGNRQVAVKNCTDPALGGVDVRGKIVLCMASEEDGGNSPRVCNAAAAGATAVVLMNQRTSGYSVGNTLCLDFVADRKCGTPTVQVSYQDSLQLQAYTASPNPTATIRFTQTRLSARPNPRVASFSSRGPSSVNNGILKPDILGPGVNILSSLPSYSPFQPFVMVSGTSLACPHLSGIAAMLKKSHPTWSPAAIKSAIITTADVLDNRGRPITDETGGRADLFATGAGLVNPTKADDPGLVYDLDPHDYTRYVCGLRYTQSQVKAVLRRSVDCNVEGRITGEELNYPSFSVSLASTAKSVSRTVTNVQRAMSASYTVSVDPIPGVRVDVRPQRLEFQADGERKNFTVNFVPSSPRGIPGTTADSQLRWVSERSHHVVRSPIVVSFA